jgi:hypothetical protein
VRTIIVVGGNLFQLASAELGSALQWINIAKANNLTDPVLTDQMEIIIPPFSTAFLDGIGPQ